MCRSLDGLSALLSHLRHLALVWPARGQRVSSVFCSSRHLTLWETPGTVPSCRPAQPRRLCRAPSALLHGDTAGSLCEPGFDPGVEGVGTVVGGAGAGGCAGAGEKPRAGQVGEVPLKLESSHREGGVLAPSAHGAPPRAVVTRGVPVLLRVSRLWDREAGVNGSCGQRAALGWAAACLVVSMQPAGPAQSSWSKVPRGPRLGASSPSWSRQPRPRGPSPSLPRPFPLPTPQPRTQPQVVASQTPPEQLSPALGHASPALTPRWRFVALRDGSPSSLSGPRPQAAA